MNTNYKKDHDKNKCTLKNQGTGKKQADTNQPKR